MNNMKNNIAANLRYLRNRNGFSQEYVAEKIGVSRQAVAKWESGDSLPDIVNCSALADLFEVSLNDLVRYDAEKEGMPIPPINKHIFGVVTVGDRGQISLPKKARELFNLQPGDSIVVLGDTGPHNPGMALVDSKTFLRMTGHEIDKIFKGSGE